MQSNRFLCIVISAIISLAMASTPAHAIWTSSVYHPELNSGSDAANAPCLSADGLTVYFGRNVPSLGAVALFTATRPDLDSAFGPQTMISELFHGTNINAPWLSADGLRLYYHEVMQPDGRAYIRMAVRSDPTQPWAVARTFIEIHSAGKYDVSPSLSGDELILVYQLETGIASDPRYVCIATRTSIDAPFGPPSRVTEIGAGVSSGPFISPDGLQLYCTRYLISENSGDIVVAKRASTSGPFSSPSPFSPFNKVGLSEQNVAFTADMKQICYNGTWIISPLTEGIYTSYWYEPGICYEILDGNYRSEMVAAYRADSGVLGGPAGMTFGPDGSVYVTHGGEYDGNLLDGTVYKTAMSGQVTKFATGMTTPCDIEWGGGTPYGDFFYIADLHNAPTGRVWKVSPTGSKSSFATVDSHPFTLALDRIGLYGGKLFMTNATRDHTYTLSATGAVTKFSDFPYNDDPGWGVAGMAFAPEGEYGGLLYALTIGVTPAGPKLLYTLDTSGVPTPLAPDFIAGGSLHFDTTAQQFFGGSLFARAVLAGDVGPYRSIFCVSPAGQTARFIRKVHPDQGIAAFTFGPDGAMYVAEYNGKYDTTIISRIVPAGPYLAALSNLKQAMIAKQKAIADVNEAITKEKLALKALTELSRTKGINGATKRGIMAAFVKISVAKVQEETALRMLLKTLPLLDEAWDIIINQVAPGIDVPGRHTPLKPCPDKRDR